MTTIVTLVWHWHKLHCNVWLNSLTSLHLCFSQWQINNGQSSFVWLFRYQSYFWLFFWLVEFFWDWNAKGSAEHVYFLVQWKAAQSKCSTGCVRLSGVEETPYPIMQKAIVLMFTSIFHPYFSGPWIWPERIPNIMPILEEHSQTKSQGLFQD